MQKGNYFENIFSLQVHQELLPVLISSQLLRSFNAGQVDVAGLCRINNSWVLHLFEVKFSQVPSPRQWRRLLLAQDYLSKILEIETKLEVKFCQKADP